VEELKEANEDLERKVIERPPGGTCTKSSSWKIAPEHFAGQGRMRVIEKRVGDLLYRPFGNQGGKAQKICYDIWGDTVNVASRIESSGEGGNIYSGATFTMVKDWFTCLYRGKVSAINKGDVDMYFVQKDSR